MTRVSSFLVASFVIGWFGMPLWSAETSTQQNVAKPLMIDDLEPSLDGKEVTVKFTVTKLEGVAQFAKEGQAPTFVIETDQERQKNMLSVWIQGELANVLNRLQMSAYQDNALKAGTVICATGKMTMHKSIPNQYFLTVEKWQDFRILPVKQDE